MRRDRWRRLAIALALELIPVWAVVVVVALTTLMIGLAHIDESFDNLVFPIALVPMVYMLIPFAGGGIGWLYTGRTAIGVTVAVIRVAIVLTLYWAAAASFGAYQHTANQLGEVIWPTTVAFTLVSPALLLIFELLDPSQPRPRKTFVVPKRSEP
jgi:hypothetical protein